LRPICFAVKVNHVPVAIIPGGVVHDLPDDLAAGLVAEPMALTTWHDITPLARNE
jgi:hypothetical protein